jgi:hypothetical protein
VLTPADGGARAVAPIHLGAAWVTQSKTAVSGCQSIAQEQSCDRTKKKTSAEKNIIVLRLQGNEAEIAISLRFNRDMGVIIARIFVRSGT